MFTTPRGLIQKYAPIILVLLVATYLRSKDIGLSPMGADDAVISLKALDVARHDQFTLLGPVMSVGLWHSPFSIYFYALPYALSTDPRIARLFTGLFNVIGVALVYYIGAKFLNRPAGIIAALLVAVHSEMVFWGRGIWNPNIGAPFALLYLATSLRGYYLNHRPSRLINLLALSLSAQCHPAVVLLLPISPILFVYAWLKRPAQRWPLIWQTVAGGVLAALSLLPWGLGLYSAIQVGGSQTEASLVTGRGFSYMFQVIYDSLGNWRPHFFQPVLPTLVVVGAIWLVLRFVRQRGAGVPGLVIALSFFLVPILSLALNAKFRNHFLASSYPNSLLIVGALLGNLLTNQWRGLSLKWLVPPLVTFIVGLNLIYNFEPPESYLGPRYSLDEQIGAIRAAEKLAADTGRDLLLLADDTGNEPPYTWELLNAGRPSRVIWSGRPLPVAAKGAVLVGFAADASRPDFFSGGQLFGKYFRIVELPIIDPRSINWPAPQPVQFTNGTQVLGFFTQPANTAPAANQPWTVYLLARVTAPNAIDQTFFVHLVNTTGDKYAQVDLPALPAGEQRTGEMMVAQFNFQPGEGLPTSGPLYLRFGMYAANGQAKVLDANQNISGDFGLIQIRGQRQPLVSEGSVWLDDLTTRSPLVQGPPLEVTATWHIRDPIAQAFNLHWQLRNPANQVVYETTDALDSTFPVGAFVNAQYRLRIPTDLAPTRYTLELNLSDSNNQDQWTQPFRQPIEIQPRPRQFQAPAITRVVNATYGNQIKLLGYDLNQSDKQVHLILYWQPRTTIQPDYKYFVHVWQNGQVLAQIDSAPAQYQYLTSWWAAGEIISEPVTLDLSALASGDYTLTTGFYDPTTGDRLSVTLADGTQPTDEWVTIQTIHLP